jgi:hypothetical protein
MDNKLKSALEYADYHKSLTTQRLYLKEKLDADLTFGFNGGIFKIDHELINFVNFLISYNRIESIPVLDSNKNPVIITNLKEFSDKIIDRYFSATSEYIDHVEKLKKARSIYDLEKL